MRLLFDENLSPRLVDLLQPQFPASEHVDSAWMRGSPDSRIWQYAKDHGLTIVSKDNDFRQLSFLTIRLCSGSAQCALCRYLPREGDGQIESPKRHIFGSSHGRVTNFCSLPFIAFSSLAVQL